MERRHKIAWLVVVAALGLTLIPAMDASARTSKQSASEKKQNQRIQRALNQVAAVGANVTAVTAQLAAANTTASGIDARLKVIEGAAPAIITGLTQLKDGLTAVAAGLQTAGAGLTKLSTFVQSTEYGIAQVVVAQPGPTIVPEGGSFLETPDIPDTVQQAQTEQQFTAQHPGNLVVLFGVRSNESDGTGASNPAANCRVIVQKEDGPATTTAANPAFGGLPFQPVPLKSAMTSTDPANAGFPFGLKSTGADADQTVQLPTAITVAAGDTYTVSLSCVDTSPDANDPTA
jgi:hypothetical protein